MRLSRPRSGLASILVIVSLMGCSVDQTDLVYLSFDSPVLLPTFAPPSDSLRRPRLSISVTRPSLRVREGFLDVDQPNVDWPTDSISGPDGVPALPLLRRGANNAATHWNLPTWQGSLSFEFPLDDRSIVGVAAHGYDGASGRRWFAEVRMGIDASSRAPFRFSLGGFYGRHDVRGAYMRRIDEGPPLTSWLIDRQETGGVFADAVFIPSSSDPAVVPVLGVTFIRQRLLVHHVPSPAPSAGTVDVAEWMTLWGLSLAIRGRLSPSADLMIGARLVIDPSIDYTSTTSFIMPMAQFNFHF